MKKLFIFLLLGIVLSSFASAVCTVTFDKTTYFPGESVTATMSCNDATEKSKAYSLLWANQTGTNLLKTSSGTTPATTGQAFFATYSVPLGVANFTLNATLTGTNLEGYDSASIVASALSSSLIIKNVTFTQPLILIGKKIGISFNVFDENNKKVNNALCDVHIEDGSGFPIDSSVKDIKTYDGSGQHAQIISKDNFDENRQYVAHIGCNCGISGTELACHDEDGNEVASSSGSVNGVMKVHKWLNVNTIAHMHTFEPKHEIFICANVTNLNYSSRIPMEIYHQVRCSAYGDNNADTDRVLVVSDDDMPDERGISASTTQMQCKSFILPESRLLQGHNSTCYASTNVWVINEERKKIIGYATTSPPFTIVSRELQIDADWQWQGNNLFNSIINLSHPDYACYNATGIGNLDVRIAKPTAESLRHEDQYDIKTLAIEDFMAVRKIANITVNNGTALQKITNWDLEYLNDGYLEIEIRNVDISKNGWYNVTIEFDDFEERQALALEGVNKSQSDFLIEQKNQSASLRTIANNTGTFFFDIDMDTEIFNNFFSYTITAIREIGTGDIEGTFECFVDGYKLQTKDRWQQSIEYPDGMSNIRRLTMPKEAAKGNYYTLKCNLGTAGFGNTITTAEKKFYYHGADNNQFFEDIKGKITTPKGIFGLFIVIGICLFIYFKEKEEKNNIYT